ncbi:hypothetical protein [Bacillus cereus group sp. N21]|uniref:hypothetical protein n=1 Tax=Bacillus cereus group sp. N21 TaxID=2794591 RepID=UPI001F5B7D9C|nr:hypothetical protein [Bacillus cereus group sp. N21]
MIGKQGGAPGKITEWVNTRHAGSSNKLNDEIKRLEASLAKGASNGASISKPRVIEELNGPVLDAERIGSATKVDKNSPIYTNDLKSRPYAEKGFPQIPKEHGFPDVIDNYSRFSQRFLFKGGDGIERDLFQVEGFYNGKNGVFEWIIEPNGAMSHRRFITDGVINGIPNQIPKKQGGK